MFGGYLCGYHGIVYMDHNGHQYKYVIVIFQLNNNNNNIENRATIKDDEGDPITVIKTVEMPSWKVSFTELSWDQFGFNRVSKLLFAHQLLLLSNSTSKDKFITFSQDMLEKRKVLKDFVPIDILDQIWNYQKKDLSPVAAVVGGLVAQEMIKVLSGKDEPYGNCFVFDGIQSRGIIESLDITKPPTKRKFIGEAIEL